MRTGQYMVRRLSQLNDLGNHKNLQMRGVQRGRQPSHGPRTRRLIAGE